MKTLLLSLSLISLLSSNLLYADGETLFKNKCASCHMLSFPEDKSQLIAPPAQGLMRHLREEFDSDTKIMQHIQSFTMNPSEEKAICRSVRRFGLMPSQKENITTEELATVSQWMVDNLTMSKNRSQGRKGKASCKTQD